MLLLVRCRPVRVCFCAAADPHTGVVQHPVSIQYARLGINLAEYLKAVLPRDKPPAAAGGR
jgi:hypothetical protein